MKAGRKSYLLRINERLWNDLNEWAGQEFRSVNGQIEVILQRAVNERKRSKQRPVDGDIYEAMGGPNETHKSGDPDVSER